MSEKDQSDEATTADDEAEPQTDSELEPELEAEPEPEPEAAKLADVTPLRRSGSGAVAWLALFVSLTAAAAIGYTIVEDWRAKRAIGDSRNSVDDSIASLSGRVDASSESLTGIEREIAELGSTDARVTADIEGLQQDLDNRVRLLDALPSRMSGLESSLANLQGISAGARDNWLLAESEYYMQIANAQLQLAGNPHLAALALGMADERIAKLANPGLIDVRRALANELAALEVMEKPDIEGVSLTLASLARVVDSLPLRQAAATDLSDPEQTDNTMGRIDRAWNSVKAAASGLVKVTPPDQAAMPLIAPASLYFLRTNLSLQLQTARLALLRGESAVFQQSLDDAAAWLEQYFDTDSPQVEGALQTIAEIRDNLFTVTPPDISSSLQLLRQFKTLAVPTQ